MCSSPARWFPAFQPHVLPTGRAIRRRPVHLLHLAGRWRRPFLYRHPRPPGRFRRRAEHGPRPARRRHATPAWLDIAHGHGRAAAAASWWCRWSQTFQEAASPPSSKPSMPLMWQEGRHAAGARDDLRRRRHPLVHRGGHRLPVQGAFARRPPRRTGRGRRRHPGGAHRRRPSGRGTATGRPGGLPRGSPGRHPRRRPLPLRRPQHRGPGRLVGGLYEPPSQFRDW